MKMLFTYHDVDKSEALEYTFREKFKKFEKLSLEIDFLDVLISKNSHRFKVTVTAHLNHTEMVVCCKGEDVKALVGETAENLGGMLRKEKTKHDKGRRVKTHAKETMHEVTFVADEDEEVDALEEINDYVVY